MSFLQIFAIVLMGYARSLIKELKTIFPYRRRKLTKNLTDNEKIRKQIYWDMDKLFKNGDPDEAIKYLKKLITRKYGRINKSRVVSKFY